MLAFFCNNGQKIGADRRGFQVAFMPTLVLAAQLCPAGVEGTLFATLMSVFNAGPAPQKRKIVELAFGKKTRPG